MKRQIEDKLLTMLADQSQKNVIIVEGARQVGKSYLVNHVLQAQQLPHLSFDLEKNLKLRRQIDETEDFFDYDIADEIMAGLEEDFRRRENQQPELFRQSQPLFEINGS